ncbi:hypothetical protein [Desulfonauticus submarinus]
MAVKDIATILKNYNVGENPQIAIVGAHGCVDKDTEFLTPTGWKKISDFGEGDKICVVNPYDDYKAWFEKPTNYIKVPTDEYGYRIFPHKNNKISMFVSREHRILYERVKNRRRMIYVRNAEEFFNYKSRRKTIPSRFKIQNTKGIDLNEWQLRLMVAVCADGSLYKDQKKCAVNLKKERKQKRLEWLLNKCNIEYSIQKSAEGYKKYYFAPPLFTRRLSDFAWNATLDQLKIIADESIFWDDRLNGHNLPEFYTCDKSEADFMQYCYQNIFPNVVGILEENRVNQKYKDSKYIRKSKEYRVYVNKSWSKSVNNTYVERKKFPDGFKYCFTTSTGFWLARKDDFIFVTGNSGKTTLAKKIVNALKIRYVPEFARELLDVTKYDWTKGDSWYVTDFENAIFSCYAFTHKYLSDSAIGFVADRTLLDITAYCLWHILKGDVLEENKFLSFYIKLLTTLRESVFWYDIILFYRIEGLEVDSCQNFIDATIKELINQYWKNTDIVIMEIKRGDELRIAPDKIIKV